MSNESQLTRKRSTSTLANTISFTHTRTGNSVNDEEIRSPATTTFSRNASSPFGHMHRNNSSSTLHSITQTLSSVGFNPVATPLHSGTDPFSPTGTGKKENALTRAKIFAKTKTKELKRSKTESQHHNFLKTKNHQGLSSSSSNSKLESGSTLYSFDPSSILDDDVLLKQFGKETGFKNLTFEEKDQVADNIWATITRTVLPLFKVDSNNLKLKTPIENINIMFEVYLRLRKENKISGTTIIGEIQEFLKMGLNILGNELSFNEDIDRGVFFRISITWEYFMTKIYHYLLGVLLPLQLDLETSKEHWSEISEIGSSSKKLLLTAFREYAVIPYLEFDAVIPDVDPYERRKLIQCFGMLKSIKSNTYNQKVIEHISSILESSLENRLIET